MATEEQEEEQYVQEEEVTSIPGWAPSVSLEVKETVPTGEEEEEELYTQRSKLYRFRDMEWKERGLGDAKILKHKVTGRVRFILRQEKTMKIVANHYVIELGPYCDLKPNAGSEKCWVWTADDWAEDEHAVEQFALKFGSAELAQKFKAAFDDAKVQNSEVREFQNLGSGTNGTATAPAPGSKEPDADSSPTAEASAETKPKESSPTVSTPTEAPKDAVPNPFAGMSFTASTSGSLFSTAVGESSGGLFGSSSSASTGSLFSSPSSSSSFSFSNASSSSSGLFGGSTAATGGLFSGSTAATGGLFSGLSSSPSSGGLFSGGMFSSPSSGGGLFSSAAPAATSSLWSTPAAAASTNEDGGANDEEYVAEEEVTSIPGWAPSVTLEVKEVIETGEEDEEELYSQRSKLYRFRDGDWKERGLGNARLLKHKTTGKVRFMLRQEKTMKIVANHYVVGVPPYCDLQPNSGSDKCWVWMAQDCADGELQTEQLALKFGSPELASKFKESFDDAKELNSKVDEFQQLLGGVSTTPKALGATSKAAAKPPSTEVNGDSKPPSSPSPKQEPASQPGLFSSLSTGGSLFGSSSSSSASTGGLFSSLSLGGSTATSGGGLFGGSASSGGLFGGSTSTSGGLFSGGLFSSTASSGGLFSSASTSASSSLWSAPATAAPATEATNDDDEYVAEEEVTAIPGWAPSVTLEVKEIIETGEEDEEELYSQRSKLYRFRDGDWKERGLGTAKLLKHKESGKVRFMLRQEKTMKIVANHYVVCVPPYCDLQPNAGSEKCWVWMAQDCSDGEIQTEQLALKFGSPELAQGFKTAFDQSKEVNAQVEEFQTILKAAGSSPSSKPSAQPKASPKLSPKLSPKTSPKSSPKLSPKTTVTKTSPKPSPKLSPKPNGNPEASKDTTSSAANPFSTFSFSNASTGGGLFSNAATGGLFSTPASTGGLFSSPAASGGLFSTPASTGGLFSTPASTGGLFNSPASTGGLFSSLATASTGGLFSNLVSASTGGLFSTPSSSSSSGLFSNSASSGGLFGGGGGLFGASGTTGGGLFGSATTGGGGGLFSSASTGGLFSGLTNATPTPGLWSGTAEAEKTENDEDSYVIEEEVTTIPGWMPSVNLDVKDYIETGEEYEEELFTHRAKLYRFSGGEWKERGTGEVKLLRHYETNKVRFLLRQEKTMKVVANHYVVDCDPYCVLKHSQGSTKCWVWTALDCADGEPQVEQFGVKFKTQETADAFRLAFMEARELTGNSADGAAYDDEDEGDWVEAEVEYANGDGQATSTSTSVPKAFSLSQMAADQASSGWRCSSCRLQWRDEDYECGVCEIPRPGFESKVEEEKAKKESGMKNAAAAFLGSSSGPSATGFGLPSSAPATSLFASSAASSASAPMFGFAAPSTTPTPATSTSTVIPAGLQSIRPPTPATSGSIFGATPIQPVTPTQPVVVPPPPRPTTSPAAPMFPIGVSPMTPTLGMLPGGLADPNYQAAFAPLAQMLAQMGRVPTADTSNVESQLKRLENSLKDQEDRLVRAEDRARKAEANAKRAEEEIETLRVETTSLRRKQQEDSELLRRLQQKSEDQLQLIDALRRDLKQEQAVRASLEVAQNASSDTMQSVLKVANSALQVAEGAQQAVRQLREERPATSSVAQVEALERSMRDRFEALESRLDRSEALGDASTLRATTPANRIAYFQGLHVQQTGRRLLGLQDSTTSTSHTDGTSSPTPLLRRIQ